MKKILVFAFLTIGLTIANTSTYAYWVPGVATLRSWVDNVITFSCPGNGLCFEGEGSGGPKPGDKIKIMFASGIVEAVLMSVQVNDPSDPGDDTYSVRIVH